MNEKGSGWTSPTALLSILSILLFITGGYFITKDNSEEAVAVLQSRVDVLQSQVADLRENQRELMSERRERERRE